eukprot:2419353-Pyramimonas_sp.AAC.1
MSGTMKIDDSSTSRRLACRWTGWGVVSPILGLLGSPPRPPSPSPWAWSGSSLGGGWGVEGA